MDFNEPSSSSPSFIIPSVALPLNTTRPLSSSGTTTTHGSMPLVQVPASRGVEVNLRIDEIRIPVETGGETSSLQENPAKKNAKVAPLIIGFFALW